MQVSNNWIISVGKGKNLSNGKYDEGTKEFQKIVIIIVSYLNAFALDQMPHCINW